MAGDFCIEDIPGIHCLPAAIRHELNLFRVVIFFQVPPDHLCQPFLVYRFEQVVERAGFKAVENIIPVSSDIDNGAVRVYFPQMRGKGKAIVIFQMNVQQEQVKGGWLFFHLCKQRRRGGKTMDGIINIAFQVPVLQDVAEHGFILLGGVWFIITDGNPVHRHPPFHSRDIIAHRFSNVKMENPELLILDELMNGLDKQGVSEIRALLLSLKNEGKIILLASHNKEDIEILCDEVYEIDDGMLNPYILNNKKQSKRE